MPRKITKKKISTQNQELRSIQELDNIDIFNSIESDQTSFTNIISQLEHCLEDQRELLLKNFVILYMKLCGLEEFVGQLEEQNDMDDFKLSVLLQKVEDLQIKNDKRSLISEDTAKKLIDKTKDNEHFYENIVKFFNTLFSAQTDLPFNCDGFLDLNFSWLADLMRCRVRIVRVACLEIIQLILSSIFTHINSMDQDEHVHKNNNKTKSLIKFAESIRFHIISYTIKDVYTPIQKKTINICFQYLMHLPTHLGNPSQYESLGLMFTHEKSECRAEAMNCLNLLINQAIINKNETLQQICLDLFTQQQDRIISPIFDHNNELSQVETIKTIKCLLLLPIFNQKCFKVQNIQSLIKILYRSNDRVKYELIFLIQQLDEEFNTCLNGKGSQSLQQVVELCLKHRPDNISISAAAQKFISPFLLIQQAVSVPENYISLMLEHEDHSTQSQIIISDRPQILQTLICFYGECVRLGRVYESSSNLFCWIVFEEQKLEQLCSIFETFSHTFFKHLKTLQLQFQVSTSILQKSNNDILVAYLELLGQLNLAELYETQNFEIFEHLLISIQRIYEKSQNHHVLKLCALLFKQLNLLDGPSKHTQKLQEVAKEIKNALAHFIEKDGITDTNQTKILYMIQYTHVLLTELLSAQQIQELRIQFQDVEKQDKYIELLAYSVISAFKTFLRIEIKTLKYATKNLQDYFEEYELTRNIFFEDAFKSLEQNPSIHTYQQLINVLSYITNNKVSFTRAFSFQLNEQQQILLYQTFYKNVLKKLDVQGQIVDENDSIETINTNNQIEHKLTDLSESELKCLTDTLNLFKISLKCIDMNFGIPVLHFLLSRSLEAKSKQGYLANLIHDLFNQWFSLEFLEQNKETLVYWKVVLDVVRFTALKMNKKTNHFYTEFWRMIMENYFVRNVNVRRVTLSIKKEKFIMFCAELIFHGFSKIEEIDILSFCGTMLVKSSRIISKLDIDKSTIKKICAFFETKKLEFEKINPNLTESEKKHLILITSPISQGLKSISGISQADLKKVIGSSEKENIQPDYTKNQQEEFENEKIQNEEDQESLISNQDILRMQISKDDEITNQEQKSQDSKKESRIRQEKIDDDTPEIDVPNMIKKKFKRERK